MPIDEEAARNMKSEEVFRRPARPQQIQGRESVGTASPSQPRSQWQPPPMSSSAPPRLQRTPGQKHSPAASPARFSDWSDSSASSSPLGRCSTGQELGYHRLCSSQQSSTNLSDQSDAASPSKSPRMEGRQSSGSSKDSPSPSQQSYSLAKYKQKVKKRLEYMYRQMSPQNLDVTNDSEVSLVSGSSEMQQETGGCDAAETNQGAGDIEVEADLRFCANVTMSSADTENFNGTVTTTVLSESTSIQNSVDHNRDLLLAAEQAVSPMETAVVGSATPQLLDLGPLDEDTSHSVQPSIATATVGSATPQLVELGPTDEATSRSIHPSIATTTVGSATPQLVELVSTHEVTYQSVQSDTGTDSVESAISQLVELGMSDGAEWQSVHSSSFPLHLLPTNGTVNQAVPWLPITSYVQFVPPTAPLTYQTSVAGQNVSAWSVASASPIANATVGSAIPQLVQLVPVQLVPNGGATWQSVHSNSFPYNHPSTNAAVNPMISVFPVIPCVQFVVPTASLTYQQPCAQQNAILWSMGSAPMTRTTDLLTGSPYGVNPYSSVQSVNSTTLLTPSTEVTDVGNHNSLEVPGSQQTTSVAEAAADESAITGALGSAPTVETTHSASNSVRQDYRGSPVTAPTDPSVSATQSSTQTKTHTSVLEQSMVSNLSNFRASTAEKIDVKTVQPKVVQNVAHKEPKTSTGIVSGRAATNQAQTTAVGNKKPLSVISILKKKLINKQTCHPLDASTSKDASSQRNELPELTVNKMGASSDPGRNWRKTVSPMKTGRVESARTGLMMRDANCQTQASEKKDPSSSSVSTANKNSSLNNTVLEFHQSRTQTAATSSSVEVCMQSNIAEFRASTGDQREVTKKFQNTGISSTTSEKNGIAPVTMKAKKSRARRKKQL